MKNICSLILVVATILCFCSCKNETAMDAIEPQYQKLQKVATIAGLKQMIHNASGSIGITNLKPFGPQNLVANSGPSEVYAVFSGTTGKTTYGTLNLEDITIPSNEHHFYQSELSQRAAIQDYFGNIKPVSLNSSLEDSEKYLLQENIYLPQQLFVDQPAQRGGPDRLTHQTTISWNADLQNKNGVFILIDFLPDGEMNEGNLSTTFLSHQKLIYTQDDGSYQFNPEDFNNIPSGAYVSFMVGRGDYIETKGTDNNSYIIYSFTGAIGTFFVDTE